MLPSSTRHCLAELHVDTLRTVAREAPSSLLKAALDDVQHLLALARAEAANLAGDKQILTMLGVFAETYQVTLPEQIGLDLYCATLNSVSASGLRHAAHAVARKHSYKTLPNPAEFHKPASEYDELRNLNIRNMEWQARKLRRVLDMQGEP